MSNRHVAYIWEAAIYRSHGLDFEGRVRFHLSATLMASVVITCLGAKSILQKNG